MPNCLEFKRVLFLSRFEVDAAVECRETVVGHDDNGGGDIASAAEHAADVGIDGLVGAEQLSLVLSPEHVRIPIDGGEVKEQQALVEAVEAIAQERGMLFGHQAALLQVLV